MQEWNRKHFSQSTLQYRILQDIGLEMLRASVLQCELKHTDLRWCHYIFLAFLQYFWFSI